MFVELSIIWAKGLNFAVIAEPSFCDGWPVCFKCWGSLNLLFDTSYGISGDKVAFRKRADVQIRHFICIQVFSQQLLTHCRQKSGLLRAQASLIVKILDEFASSRSGVGGEIG